MLERYFVKPSTVDRIRASWLAPEIERYVEWMDLQGYAIRNVYRRVPMLCRFAEFAKQHGCTDLKSAVTQIESFASDWPAAHGANCRRKMLGTKLPKKLGIRSARCCCWRWKGRVFPARECESRFHSRTKRRDFFCYLAQERGLRRQPFYGDVHRSNGFGRLLEAVGCQLTGRSCLQRCWHPLLSTLHRSWRVRASGTYAG